jgi:hypothetical protein
LVVTLLSWIMLAPLGVAEVRVDPLSALTVAAAA